MARTLQLKWSDEAWWKPVRELTERESDLDAIRDAQAQLIEFDRKYPHHTFTAAFRVVG